MLRNIDITLKYVYSHFLTHKPIVLTHSVTSRCNCKCKICDLWKKHKNIIELNTHEIFQMLGEAKKLNFVSYIAFGGEPLLRPDIFKILNYAHNLGLYTIIITNGIYLPEKVQKIKRVVDFTFVSLDYDSEYHDELRGINGVFTNAVDGIKRLRKANRKVAINCVLSKLNMDAVSKMVQFAHRHDVKIAFDLIEVFQGSNEKYALSINDCQRLFYEIRKFKENGYPILNSNEYLEHLDNSGYSCKQPQVFIRVSEEGKIKPFWCQRTDRALGDLRKQSLNQVLSSSSYNDFTRITKGCNLCNNSCTVETSIFSEKKRFVSNFCKSNNPYLKFILDYAI